MVLESLPITSTVLGVAAPFAVDLAALGLVVGGGTYLVAKGIRKVRDAVGEALSI
jgi:hypothetical protein